MCVCVFVLWCHFVPAYIEGRRIEQSTTLLYIISDPFPTRHLFLFVCELRIVDESPLPPPQLTSARNPISHFWTYIICATSLYRLVWRLTDNSTDCCYAVKLFKNYYITFECISRDAHRIQIRIAMTTVMV